MGSPASFRRRSSPPSAGQTNERSPSLAATVRRSVRRGASGGRLRSPRAAAGGSGRSTPPRRRPITHSMEMPPRPERPVVVPAFAPVPDLDSVAYDRMARRRPKPARHRPDPVQAGPGLAAGQRLCQRQRSARPRRAGGQGQQRRRPAPGLPGHADDQRERVLPQPGGLGRPRGAVPQADAAGPAVAPHLERRLLARLRAVHDRHAGPGDRAPPHRAYPRHRPGRDDPVQGPKGRLHGEPDGRRSRPRVGPASSARSTAGGRSSPSCRR